MSSPAERALPHIRAMRGYIPGDQPEGEGWIKLNTNENPYPPSPRVGPAIEAEIARLPLYPNPTSRPLREAIAQRHGLEAAQVLVGNGCDDVLNLLVRAFTRGAEAAAGMTQPSYSLYPVLTAIQDSELISIPFGERFALPQQAIADCAAQVFFLTNPNAPTGVAFPTAQIESLLQQTRALLVVDETYAAFAKEDAVGLLDRYEHLVITRSFSKTHALAGLRVGYALAHPSVIEILDRVRDSYNVNRLSQAGALAALQDRDYYAGTVRQILATRDAFGRSLEALGWHVYPSQANFLFVRPQDRSGGHGKAVAESLFDYLKAEKILVRWFPGSPLTASYLRISIGTDAHMAQLLHIIEQWLGTTNA